MVRDLNLLFQKMSQIIIYCKDKKYRECIFSILNSKENIHEIFYKFLEKNKKKYKEIICIFQNPIEGKVFNYKFIRSPKYGEIIDVENTEIKYLPKYLIKELSKIKF